MIVGWYIHHQGLGHLQRFRIMRSVIPGLVGLSSLPRPPDVPARQWITLPIDAPAGEGSDVEAGGAMHWVPLHHPGLRARMSAVARWISARRPDVIVVDVSVEIATLARLMGVPVVWIGQRGCRTDRPHQLAYSLSTIAVPWSRAVACASPGGLPPTVGFVGAFSRFDGRPARSPPGRRRVLLLLGRGGHTVSPSELAHAQAATPSWHWTIAGYGGAQRIDDAERVWELLQDSDVVIGSGGTGVISEVASARRPFICLPQPRPFAEQRAQGDALAAAGLAETVVSWPDRALWPQLLDRAGARDPTRWEILNDGFGAQRLGDVIAAASCA